MFVFTYVLVAAIAVGSAWASAHVDPSLGILSGPQFNMRKIGEMVMEGRSKIEDVTNRDIIIIIGNTGAGKSTFVNYLMDFRFRKGKRGIDRYAVPINEAGVEVDAADPICVLAPMARPEDMISCTLLPQAYLKANKPFVLLDGQGFGEDRGTDGMVAASILTEMAIKKAKSVRVVTVISKGDVTRDGRDRLKNVCLIAHKLVNVREKRFPVGLLVNKTDEDDEARDIQQTIQDIIQGEKESAEQMLSHRLGRGVISSSALAKLCQTDVDASKRQDMVKAMEILELMSHSENMFVPNIFDTGAGRQRLWQFLGSLPVIAKSSFQFSGYNDARKQFDRNIENIARVSLEILQVRAALPRYMTILQQKKRDAESILLDIQKNLKDCQTSIEKVDSQVEQMTLQISVKKERISTLSYEKSTIENDRDKVTVWRDSWCERICRPWVWYRNYRIDYDGAQFDDYDVDLESGTSKMSGWTNGSSGRFVRRYESDAGCNCEGSVRLYRYYCNTSPARARISNKMGEINRLNVEIDELRKDIQLYFQKKNEEVQKSEQNKRRISQALQEVKNAENKLQIKEIVSNVERIHDSSVQIARFLIGVPFFKEMYPCILDFSCFITKFDDTVKRGSIDQPNDLVPSSAIHELMERVASLSSQ